jgi:hypothetical protein
MVTGMESSNHETWQQASAILLAVVGASIVVYGLLGVLGYMPFRQINMRGLTKLHEKVPAFRGMPEEKIHTIQSWGMLIVGIHVLLIGVLLLIRAP